MGDGRAAGTHDGARHRPGERLAAEDALRLLTRNGAWLSFDETRKGTLETGKLADLAVLSRDPRDTPVDALPEVRSTADNGRRAYRPRERELANL
jgi:predicted amidohydrolase YtcJ